jgi:hypothetical protein
MGSVSKGQRLPTQLNGVADVPGQRGADFLRRPVH